MATVPPVGWAFSPLDEHLGLRPKVGFTPKVEEGIARLGTWMPFRAGQRELAFFLGVRAAEASIRKITEQAGEASKQVQAEEVESLLHQRPESPAGPGVQLMSLDGALIQLVTGEWKEVKTLALGVVKEITRVSKKHPEGERRVQTTDLSYFSRMSEAQTFQQQALAEVHRRGVEKAGTVCAVSDGAEWIQKWVDYHRPDAVRILDFAHAMEYVSKAGQAAQEKGLLFSHEPGLRAHTDARGQQERFKQWLQQQGHELKTGETQRVLAELERLRTLLQEAGQPEAVHTLEQSLHYLRERRSMMRYASFRAQGYPIGSGSVESANKLVVQSRMKQAGLRWGPSHVDAMLAMRNLACNDRWGQGWEDIRGWWHQQQRVRRTQRAARSSTPEASAAQASPIKRLSAEKAGSAGSASPPLPTSSAQAPTQARPVRPTPTHPWRRPFLRRRSG